ncbi:putative NTP pyrophosphohydrolase protein [Rhizobium phage RHph_I72]|nr:putative NTP pyrophosphohydrolase protein [Rhizobium phage RHph_I72]
MDGYIDDPLKGRETAQGRINRLATALNIALPMDATLRVFSTGTRVEIRPANGNYYDPGLDQVAEFSKAFDAHIADEPGVPRVDRASQEDIENFVKEAARYGRWLKDLAAGAKARGDEAGALLLIRLQLCQEELAELADAMAKRDIVGCLDALVDMSYVGDGTYLSLGLGPYKLAGYAEVHRSNMSKLDNEGKPIISDAGRVIKGPNYSKPDLASVLGLSKEDS